MKKITFRIFVAIITFIIGIFVASFYFFIDNTNIVENLDSSINENIETAVACDYVSNQELNENEEYAVYSEILSGERYNSDIIVINDFTSQGLIADAENLNSKIPGLTQDTINDYQAKKVESRKLENSFTVSGKVVFLSEEEETQLFRNGLDGWNKFYKKYPEANGIITFSRVGFNKERTQALVYVGIGCGGLCGDGSFMFLEKINGKWSIRGNKNLWVS